MVRRQWLGISHVEARARAALDKFYDSIKNQNDDPNVADGGGYKGTALPEFLKWSEPDVLATLGCAITVKAWAEHCADFIKAVVEEINSACERDSAIYETIENEQTVHGISQLSPHLFGDSP